MPTNAQAAAQATVAEKDHRRRLLEGMAHAVAAKGYAETTIADIVREASVSRRTFYEHFSGKAECLIALYVASSRNALNVLRASIDPRLDWDAQVETAIAAYFGCLAQNPVLIRTLFVEIFGLGPEGMAARRQVNEDVAAFIVQINADDRRRRRRPPLSRELAMAIVGGINELILDAIERGRVDRLGELAAPAIQLVKALT